MVKHKVDGTLPASFAQRQRFTTGTGKRCNLYLIYIRNTSVSKQKNKAQFLLKKCHYGQIWSVNAVKHCEFCWIFRPRVAAWPKVPHPTALPLRRSARAAKVLSTRGRVGTVRNWFHHLNLGSTRVETQKGITRYKKMRNRETQGWKQFKERPASIYQWGVAVLLNMVVRRCDDSHCTGESTTRP